MRIAYAAGKMIEGYDGVTRVMFKWDEELRRREIDHIFIAGEVPPRGEQSAPMYRVFSVPFPLYKEYPFSIPVPKTFDDVLDRFEPDLLHFNSPCPLACASIKYAQRRGIPVVSTYHTHFLSYAQYYGLAPMTELCWTLYHHVYDPCVAIFVPSRPILEELKSGGIRNLAYLPHGIDLSQFNPSFRSEGWKQRHGVEGKFVALYAGRLVWEKDLRVLAEMHRLLRSRRPEVVIALAGDGPIRSELKRLMPDALFLGHLSAAEVAEAYASTDAFVFPSRTETFGNVTLEAMACGNVPVCAAAGGPIDIITHGENGFLIQPGDAEGFAAALESLADFPELRGELADSALQRAQTQSWSSIVDKMIREYRRAIASRAGTKAA